MTLALLASILLQTPAEPPPPPLDVDACLQSPPACVKIAGAHFEAGRFTEAIALFEALAHAHPQKPKYHYFAGLAWEGAGDDTAAYIHLRQFLISSKLNPDDRARAEQRVRTIGTRTTRLLVQLPARDELRTLRLKRTNPSRSGEATLSAPIIALPLVDDRREILVSTGAWELSVDPAALGDIEIPPLSLVIEPGPQRRLVELAVRNIRHELTVDLGPTKALSRGINIHLVQPGTPPVDLTAKSPTIRRELPSGHWQYEARARGFRPTAGILNLKGPTNLPIKLTTRWPLERRNRFGLGLGLGGIGVFTGIGSIVLFYLAKEKLSKEKASMPPYPVSSLSLADAGMGFAGSAVGFLIGAASVSTTSRRLWVAEATSGALLIISGTILYTYRTQTTNNNIPAPNTLFTRDIDIPIESSIMGLGAGLFTSSVASLLLKRKKNTTPHRTASFFIIPSSHIGIQAKIRF